MASPLGEYPNLVVSPGSYPCVIEHPDGQRLSAELELDESRMPRGRIFGWPVQERDGIRAFPQPVEHSPVLKCALRAGWQVLLVDAAVQAEFPEQASLRVACRGWPRSLRESR